MCLLNVRKQEQQTCFERNYYKIFDIIVQLLFFFFLQLLILTDMAFLPVALSLSFVLSEYPDIYFHESSAGRRHFPPVYPDEPMSPPCQTHETYWLA